MGLMSSRQNHGNAFFAYNKLWHYKFKFVCKKIAGDKRPVFLNPSRSISGPLPVNSWYTSCPLPVNFWSTWAHRWSYEVSRNSILQINDFGFETSYTDGLCPKHEKKPCKALKMCSMKFFSILRSSI